MPSAISITLLHLIRDPRRHKSVALMIANYKLAPLSHPITSPQDFPHFMQMCSERCLRQLVASHPKAPSTDTTNSVNEARLAIAALLYFFFFFLFQLTLGLLPHFFEHERVHQCLSHVLKHIQHYHYYYCTQLLLLLHTLHE